MSDLWSTRRRAMAALAGNLRAEAACLEGVFDALDACVGHLLSVRPTSGHERTLALFGATLAVKGRNFALGIYGLTLDGLAEEAGALVRPFIETLETLAWLNQDPSRTELMLSDDRPRAERLAKAVGHEFKDLRDYLNAQASHLSTSGASVGHLMRGDRLVLVQPYHKRMLRVTMQMIHLFVFRLAVEAAKCASVAGCAPSEDLANMIDACRRRFVSVFGETPVSRG